MDMDIINFNLDINLNLGKHSKNAIDIEKKK